MSIECCVLEDGCDVGHKLNNHCVTAVTKLRCGVLLVRTLRVIRLCHQQPTTVVGYVCDVGDILVLAGACDVEGQLSHVHEVRFQSGNVCICIIPEKCGLRKQL